MQGAAGQAALRQVGIESGQAEGQDAVDIIHKIDPGFTLLRFEICEVECQDISSVNYCCDVGFAYKEDGFDVVDADTAAPGIAKEIDALHDFILNISEMLDEGERVVEA